MVVEALDHSISFRCHGVCYVDRHGSTAGLIVVKAYDFV